MKKIFFELTSTSKKREKEKHARLTKTPELIAQEVLVTEPTAKPYQVKELLKDSDLRFIQEHLKKPDEETSYGSDTGKYVFGGFLDTVVDYEKAAGSTSWMTDHFGSASNPPKTPDMREYFEKRSIAANVHSGDSRMLRKLFWFREKECAEVKSRFLSKSLLQQRKSLHFSQMFAYLSKKLEMPAGSSVLNVAWSGCDGFLACGCVNGVAKVLKIEVVDASQNNINHNNNSGSELAVRPGGYLASFTNISKNQTLEGHSASLSALAWNHAFKKLTTADTKGLTIVWKLCRGNWCEEMVHSREGIAVEDISWSACGKRVCIIYRDGAVMVGSVEGSRLWNCDSIGQNSVLTSVTWAPSGSHILFSTHKGEILVYSQDGAPFKKIKLKVEEEEQQECREIVCIRWHKVTTASCSSWIVPTLAVVWRANYVHLLRSLADDQPILAKTNMVATCASWSPSGEFLAVGGSPVVSPSSPGEPLGDDFDQVNVFSPFGAFLQTVKIPGKSCTSLSWNSLSLRLAVGVGENVYFANVRPCYKFALLGATTLVYTFSRCDGASQIGFWDGETLSVQEVPGKVVDIRGNEEHCAILSLTTTGCYNATILNALGHPVDSITIVTIDPFMINLTATVLICVAPNGVMLWRFDTYSSSSSSSRRNDSNLTGSSLDLVARRRLRSFHIDESPSIIGESTDETKLREPTSDPAACSDAVGQMLIVCRESGKLQVYSLPHGALMNTIDTAYEMNFHPTKIFLNMDGSQVAMIDRQGHLSVCSLGSASIKTALARKLDRKDVWNLIWASDHPNLICVMEKTKMYVIRNGEAEEPVLTSSYLVAFKDLKITSVLMDELMFNPEEPRKDLIVTVETRALRQARQLLQSQAPLQTITDYIDRHSHCNLWKLLGNEALKQNALELAESSFVKAKDYAGIAMVKKIGALTNPHLRAAETAAYFRQFETAEELYARADRRDLASDMWKQLGEPKRMDTAAALGLSRHRPSDPMARDVGAAEGDFYFFGSQDWARALSHYEADGDLAKVIECCVRLEDFNKLEKVAQNLRDGDPLLRQIGDVLKSHGLCREAVDAYLKYDAQQPDLAVETAIELSQWSLALQVAHQFSLSMVESLLVRYVTHLLQEGRVMTAVQLLIKSSKPFGAAKLLIITALRELGECSDHLVRIKKLFVFAAMLLEYKSVQFVKKLKSPAHPVLPTTESVSSSNLGVGNDSLDVVFEHLLPPEYRPTEGVYKWIRESPWRGAEGVHYLLLTQKLIQEGSYEGASRTALYLRSYVDVLGKERVYSIIALAAANSRNFGVCSKALIHLEALGGSEGYEDVASDLFSENFPADSNVRTVICYKCAGVIPDYSTTCPDCGITFEICAVTGRPLSEDVGGIWRCQVCQHSSELKLVRSRRSCPFCHAQRLSSLDSLA